MELKLFCFKLFGFKEDYRLGEQKRELRAFVQHLSYVEVKFRLIRVKLIDITVSLGEYDPLRNTTPARKVMAFSTASFV